MGNRGLTRVWVDVNSSIDIDVAPNGSHVAIEFSTGREGVVVHMLSVTFCRLLDRLAPVSNEIQVNQRMNGGPLDMCSDAVWSFVRRYILDASVPGREPWLRRAYTATVYVLINDVPWRRLPMRFAVSHMTAWRHYRVWRSAGLFAHMYEQSCTLGHVPDVIRVHCREVSDAVQMRGKGR